MDGGHQKTEFTSLAIFLAACPDLFTENKYDVDLDSKILHISFGTSDLRIHCYLDLSGNSASCWGMEGMNYLDYLD